MYQNFFLNEMVEKRRQVQSFLSDTVSSPFSQRELNALFSEKKYSFFDNEKNSLNIDHLLIHQKKSFQETIPKNVLVFYIKHYRNGWLFFPHRKWWDIFSSQIIIVFQESQISDGVHIFEGNDFNRWNLIKYFFVKNTIFLYVFSMNIIVFLLLLLNKIYSCFFVFEKKCEKKSHRFIKENTQNLKDANVSSLKFIKKNKDSNGSDK